MPDMYGMFFSPLNGDSCYYFLIVSMFFFVTLVFALFADVYFIIKHFKKLNLQFIQGGLLIAFNLFIAYFVHRLLFTMCRKSLK